MVYTRTLKPKFDIHPGRVRRPRTSNLRQRYLLSRREHPELVAISSPETSAINNDNAVNFVSNFADASVNSEDVVDALINHDLEEVSINSDNFEDFSSNEDDDDPENDNDFSSNEDDDDPENDNDFSSNEDDDDPENDNDFSSNEDDDDLENDNDFSQNDDYNPTTQKMADGPEPFQPFDGEYGPYFANFTEQMLFLWVTKHMICK